MRRHPVLFVEFIEFEGLSTGVRVHRWMLRVSGFGQRCPQQDKRASDLAPCVAFRFSELPAHSMLVFCGYGAKATAW